MSVLSAMCWGSRTHHSGQARYQERGENLNKSVGVKGSGQSADHTQVDKCDYPNESPLHQWRFAEKAGLLNRCLGLIFAFGERFALQTRLTNLGKHCSLTTQNF